MYKTVLYGLLVLCLVAFVESVFGWLKFSPLSLAEHFVVCITVSGLMAWILAKVFRATLGQESWLITAVILFLIVDLPRTNSEWWQVVAILALAQFGKFILQWKKLHVFNPAAMATYFGGLAGSGMASWWVGSRSMLPTVAIVGFLVVRKVKREKLVLIVMLEASIMTWFSGGQAQYLWLSGPLVFFATIMLTEPITGATNLKTEIIMGLIVGLAYYKGPEQALLLGNLVVYILAKKRFYLIEFVEKQELGDGVWKFVFTATEKIAFKAGQYIEWTLPGVKIDMRGNRRYFTLANGPGNEHIELIIRVPESDCSQYKKRLLQIRPGEEVKVSLVAGDFVAKKEEKMAWLAGGIGITPFASMAKDLDKISSIVRPVLLYVNKGDNFPMATEIENSGVTVVRHNTDKYGYLEDEKIKELVPDFKERVFFVSGPGGMVARYKNSLTKMGVKKIVTDYFPGF